MKRGTAYLLAFLIILVLICPVLIGMSFAKTVTPKPTNSEPAFPPPNTGTSINSVTGTVYDASGNVVPNAKVTLYNVAWIDNNYKPMEPASTKKNNPQWTGDGVSSDLGKYEYTGVLSGPYIITAEKGGVLVSNLIWVTGGTLPPTDIFIQGYVENGASPTPGATITEGPTYRPPPTATADVPTPDIGSILSDIFKISLMAIIAVQFVASIAILALGFGKH